MQETLGHALDVDLNQARGVRQRVGPDSTLDANQSPARCGAQAGLRPSTPLLTGASSMKPVSAEEAVAMIPNGATVMVGGFMGVGTPERLLDELVRQKKSGLSVIANDAAVPGRGIGKLFDASLV